METTTALALVDSEKLVAQVKQVPEFSTLKSKQRRFLLCYMAVGRITVAATKTNVSWMSHYHWLHHDENYKTAFERSKEIFGDLAEGEIFHRAFIGEPRTIVKGKGEYRIEETLMQKSDILAMFALKGLKPQYRDNFIVGGAAGPTHVSIVLAQGATLPNNSIPQLNPPVKNDDKT